MTNISTNITMALADNSSKIEDLEANLDTFFMLIMAIIISCEYLGERKLAAHHSMINYLIPFPSYF